MQPSQIQKQILASDVENPIEASFGLPQSSQGYNAGPQQLVNSSQSLQPFAKPQTTELTDYLTQASEGIIPHGLKKNRKDVFTQRKRTQETMLQRGVDRSEIGVGLQSRSNYETPTNFGPMLISDNHSAAFMTPNLEISAARNQQKKHKRGQTHSNLMLQKALQQPRSVSSVKKAGMSNNNRLKVRKMTEPEPPSQPRISNSTSKSYGRVNRKFKVDLPQNMQIQPQTLIIRDPGNQTAVANMEAALLATKPAFYNVVGSQSAHYPQQLYSNQLYKTTHMNRYFTKITQDDKANEHALKRMNQQEFRLNALMRDQNRAVNHKFNGQFSNSLFQSKASETQAESHEIISSQNQKRSLGQTQNSSRPQINGTSKISLRSDLQRHTAKDNGVRTVLSPLNRNGSEGISKIQTLNRVQQQIGTQLTATTTLTSFEKREWEFANKNPNKTRMSYQQSSGRKNFKRTPRSRLQSAMPHRFMDKPHELIKESDQQATIQQQSQGQIAPQSTINININKSVDLKMRAFGKQSSKKNSPSHNLNHNLDHVGVRTLKMDKAQINQNQYMSMKRKNMTPPKLISDKKQNVKTKTQDTNYFACDYTDSITKLPEGVVFAISQEPVKSRTRIAMPSESRCMESAKIVPNEQYEGRPEEIAEKTEEQQRTTTETALQENSNKQKLESESINFDQIGEKIAHRNFANTPLIQVDTTQLLNDDLDYQDIETKPNPHQKIVQNQTKKMLNIQSEIMQVGPELASVGASDTVNSNDDKDALSALQDQSEQKLQMKNTTQIMRNVQSSASRTFETLQIRDEQESLTGKMTSINLITPQSMVSKSLGRKKSHSKSKSKKQSNKFSSDQAGSTQKQISKKKSPKINGEIQINKVLTSPTNTNSKDANKVRIVYQPDDEPAFFNMFVEERHTEHLANKDTDEESRLQIIYRIMKDQLRVTKKELLGWKNSRDKRARQALELKRKIEEANLASAALGTAGGSIADQIKEVVTDDGSKMFKFIGSQLDLPPKMKQIIFHVLQEQSKQFKYCPCCRQYDSCNKATELQMGEFLEFIRQQNIKTNGNPKNPYKRIKPLDKQLEGDSISDITDLSEEDILSSSLHLLSQKEKMTLKKYNEQFRTILEREKPKHNCFSKENSKVDQSKKKKQNAGPRYRVQFELRAKNEPTEFFDKDQSAHQFSVRDISLQADSEERAEIAMQTSVIDAKSNFQQVDVYDLGHCVDKMVPAPVPHDFLNRTTKDAAIVTDFNRRLICTQDWFFSELFRDQITREYEVRRQSELPEGLQARFRIHDSNGHFKDLDEITVLAKDKNGVADLQSDSCLASSREDQLTGRMLFQVGSINALNNDPNNYVTDPDLNSMQQPLENPQQAQVEGHPLLTNLSPQTEQVSEPEIVYLMSLFKQKIAKLGKTRVLKQLHSRLVHTAVVLTKDLVEGQIPICHVVAKLEEITRENVIKLLYRCQMLYQVKMQAGKIISLLIKLDYADENTSSSKDEQVWATMWRRLIAQLNQFEVEHQIYQNGFLFDGQNLKSYAQSRLNQILKPNNLNRIEKIGQPYTEAQIKKLLQTELLKQQNGTRHGSQADAIDDGVQGVNNFEGSQNKAGLQTEKGGSSSTQNQQHIARYKSLQQKEHMATVKRELDLAKHKNWLKKSESRGFGTPTPNHLVSEGNCVDNLVGGHAPNETMSNNEFAGAAGVRSAIDMQSNVDMSEKMEVVFKEHEYFKKGRPKSSTRAQLVAIGANNKLTNTTDKIVNKQTKDQAC